MQFFTNKMCPFAQKVHRLGTPTTLPNPDGDLEMGCSVQVCASPSRPEHCLLSCVSSLQAWAGLAYTLITNTSSHGIHTINERRRWECSKPNGPKERELMY
jgi:hypothetical protein